MKTVLTILGMVHLIFSGAPLYAQTGMKEPLPVRKPVGSDLQTRIPGSEPEPRKTVPGSDRSIYVVQERAYSKSKAVEITPFFFTKINPKFVGYVGGGISAAYHFKENFGLEFLSAIPGPFFNAFYSNLVTEVFQYESLTPEEVDLKRMTYFGALSLNFSALYGKWDLYGLLLDYDFYAHAGIGLVTLKETCAPPNTGNCGPALASTGRGLRAPDLGRDRFKITGNLGFGLRVYFLRFLGFRIELRDIVYADRDVEAGQTTSDIRNELMVFLGASFLIHPL